MDLLADAVLQCCAAATPKPSAGQKWTRSWSDGFVQSALARAIDTEAISKLVLQRVSPSINQIRASSEPLNWRDDLAWLDKAVRSAVIQEALMPLLGGSGKPTRLQEAFKHAEAQEKAVRQAHTQEVLMALEDALEVFSSQAASLLT